MIGLGMVQRPSEVVADITEGIRLGDDCEILFRQHLLKLRLGIVADSQITPKVKAVATCGDFKWPHFNWCGL